MVTGEGMVTLIRIDRNLQVQGRSPHLEQTRHPTQSIRPGNKAHRKTDDITSATGSNWRALPE